MDYLYNIMIGILSLGLVIVALFLLLGYYLIVLEAIRTILGLKDYMITKKHHFMAFYSTLLFPFTLYAIGRLVNAIYLYMWSVL